MFHSWMTFFVLAKFDRSKRSKRVCVDFVFVLLNRCSSSPTVLTDLAVFDPSAFDAEPAAAVQLCANS